MENFISSVLSGISHIVGSLLGHPLDFLAGKSCSTKCQPTWDFFCYLENFCISHLLKMGMVLVLFYFVLLFFYLSYQLGICQCICYTCCRSTWTCFAACFSMLECCCNFFCLKLQKHNQRRRLRRAPDIEELAVGIDSEGSFSSQAQTDVEIARRRKLPSRRGREYRKEHLRQALRPKNHRILLRLRSDSSFDLKKKHSIKHGHRYCVSPANHIRVTKSSTLAEKGGSFKSSLSHKRR